MAKSIANCIKTLKKDGSLTDATAQDVLRRAEEYRKQGYTAEKADVMAVTDALDEQKEELVSVYSQIAFDAANDPLLGEAPVLVAQDAEKPTKQKKTAKQDNTEDSGAELTQNLRNKRTTGVTWEELAGKEAALRVKEVTKAKVYLKPDYAALAEQMSPLKAHLLKQIYDSIAPEPKTRSAPTDQELQDYIAEVNRVMDAAMDWVKSAELPAPVNGRMVSYTPQANGKKLLEVIYPSGWRESRDVITLLGGNRYLAGLQPGYDEVKKAQKDIEKGWPTPQEAWQRQGYKVLASSEAVKVRYNDYGKNYYVEIDGRFGKTFQTKEAAQAEVESLKPWLALNKNGRLIGQFQTQDEALAHVRQEASPAGREGKVSDKGIKVDNARRVGVDRRAEGENITSDQLRETFGFKGVNFGNWMKGGGVNANERQLHLNHAYDSFMDLADILGVPPKAMSLNGMLGIAFGAQGRAGAAAHFVPGVNEINLTRESGAGSLGHEFAHALDHYFARMGGLDRQAEPFLTEHTRSSASGELRPEIMEKFKAIVEAMNRRPMSPVEYAAQRRAAVEKWQKSTEGWLKHIRRGFESKEDSLAKFDEIANRIRGLKIGDGMVTISRMKAVSPAVAELRQLHKDVFGRQMSIDDSMGLQGNIDALKFATEAAADDKAHVPQMTRTDYATNAAKLDSDEGKKKPYWNTNLEKFARAFDAYLSDTLEERAALNSYLSHTGRTGMTVPTGEERTKINAAIQSLVDAIEHKATDSGVAMFSRSGGWDGFPDAVIAASLGTATSNENYAAAKSGDTDAAFKLVSDVLTNDVIDRIAAAANGSDAVIVPVHAIESAGANKIPLAFAEILADKLGLKTSVDILQQEKVSRGGADGFHRLSNQPTFGGEVAPGNYIIVDDTLTQGGTFAQLKEHIESNGGKVVLAVALTGKQYSAKIALQDSTLNELNSKYGELEQWWREQFGYGFSGLTESEGRYIIKSGLSPDAIRTRILASGRQAGVSTTQAANRSDQGPLEALLLRALTPATGSYSSAFVEQAANQLLEGLSNAPPVTVVWKPSDLPFKADDTVRGAYYKGRIYLVAGTIRGAEELREVVAHETMGHYGLRGFFGHALDGALLAIHAANPSVRLKTTQWKHRNPDLIAEYKEAGFSEQDIHTIAIEEAMAELAQDGKPITGMQKFLAVIQKLLRKMGLNRWANTLEAKSDAEAMQMLENARLFVKNGVREADMTPFKVLAAAFSRNETSDLVSVFKSLADFHQTERWPRSFQTDMAKLAEELSPQLEVGAPSEKSSRILNDEGQNEYRITERNWPASASDGSPVYITENVPAKEIYINVSELKEGESEGSLIYQLVGQYAANNGLKFIGDPNGITNAAIIRRTENMIALALKVGGTDFMAPHPDQTKAFDKRQGDDFYWPGFNWQDGDPNGNLHNMLMASYNVVKHYVPKIQDIYYDTDSKSFRDSSTGRDFTEADFGTLAESAASRECHAGRTTLKRSALVNSVAQGKIDVATWRRSLDELNGGEVGQGFEGSALKEIRYSRGGISNKQQTPINLQGGAPTTTSRWDIAPDTKLTQWVYQFQNKHVDLKAVQKSIQETQDIADGQNPYQKEELYHKRTAERVEAFERNHITPLINQMRLFKVDREELETYLHARHAQEANALLAERNPNQQIIDAKLAAAEADVAALEAQLSNASQPQIKALRAALDDAEAELKKWQQAQPFRGTEAERLSLSGMSDQDAQQHLASLTPERQKQLDALAGKVDAMIAETRKTLVQYGLESSDTIQAWEQQYQHYIPLNREDMENGMGIGQGFSVKGPASKHRTGSNRKVVDILANVFSQYDRAVTRGEKNRVAVALYGLALQNPNKDFWEADKKPQKATLTNGLAASYIDPSYMNKDNVVTMRIKDRKGNVHDRAVVFNEHNDRAMRMAAALKNLDAPQLNGLIGAVAPVTRWIAAVNTQYNPVFVAVNLVRDFQGAAINLTTTPLAGKQLQVMNAARSALWGIYSDLRDHRDGKQASSQWATLYEQMKLDGGTTGYRDMFGSAAERSISQIDKLVKDNWGRDTKLGRISTGRWLFGVISDLNETSENAVRLGVYKVALEQGLSRDQAASLAKNITVNFNRKGNIGSQMNAAYAFFNAAVQGSDRLLQVMRGPAGKRIAAGGILIGVAQAFALAAMGFGDDDPPDFVRERNLIIPTGDKTYKTIPMPLGFHVFPNLGRIVTEMFLFKHKPVEALMKFASVFAEAFNPIGNAGFSWQTLTPTVADPIIAVLENRDWTGKPIYRESRDKNKPAVDMAKDKTSWASRQISDKLSKLTGGNEDAAGTLNWNPDVIDYAWGQATGGVGREVLKAWQYGEAKWTGEEVPAHKVPLLSRFAGEAKGQSHEAQKFYENLDKLDRLEKQVKGRRERKESIESIEAFKKAHPETELIRAGNSAQFKLSQLRRDKRKLIERGDKEGVKRTEEKITNLMRQLNSRMGELSAETQ